MRVILAIGLSVGMVVAEEAWWSLQRLESPEVPAEEGEWGRSCRMRSS